MSKSKKPTKPTPKTPAPAVALSVPARVQYVVQDGDTLVRIGKRFGVHYRAIAADNGIANPDIISSGQVLVIRHDGSKV
ncbi:MAG: LysM peptidoglycan-binding domain-containing protein [Anaerolineae bacterium]